MYKFLWCFAVVALFACNQKTDNGSFTINGTMKHTVAKEVYLEELYFDARPPLVIDTAEVIDGKFVLNGTSKEEGIYRVRLQGRQNGFLFINDAKNIAFTANLEDSTLNGADFSSPANQSFKKFIEQMDNQRTAYAQAMAALNSPAKGKGADSINAANEQKVAQIIADAKKHITGTLDTVKSPAMAMFVMGYTMDIDTAQMRTINASLQKRFAKHNGVNTLVKRYNEELSKMQAQASAPVDNKVVQVGMTAPELTMPGSVDGKPVSISQFKGKYLLVDFWASWCGPCREENPNVVAAYNKYKDKNFAILGVSLDEDKAKWQQAIMHDKLTWTHMSDLKGWGSAAPSVYGFDGIPFNVLIDPSGKIIAMDLTGEALQSKLQEILK